MSIFSAENGERFASVFVPGFLIASIGIYMLGFCAPQAPYLESPLDIAKFPSVLRIGDGGVLLLDKVVFVKDGGHLAATDALHRARAVIYLDGADKAAEAPSRCPVPAQPASDGAPKGGLVLASQKEASGQERVGKMQ